MTRANTVIAFVAVALAAACSSDTDGGTDGRRAVLEALADNVYVPLANEFRAGTPALIEAVGAVCDDPTGDALAGAQSAWRDARRPFKRLEAARFGPLAELRIDGAVDFWPARTDDIDAELTLETPMTQTYVSGLASTRKGLPALEYLLFAQSDRLAEERACAYAAAIAADIDVRAADLATAWGPFRDELVTAGDGSSEYSKLSDALDDVGNALFGGVADIEGMKLAAPLGRRDGDVPQPDQAESRFADNAITDLLDALDGALAVYTSTYGAATGPSLSAATASLSPQLDADVHATFDACRAAVLAIPPPLRTAVVDAPASVDEALACTKTLYDLLVVDVAGVLGLTPTFGDNDGD